MDIHKLIYKKLNAFSVGNSNGNPAACIYLTDNQYISKSEMQAIAKEHKGFVSEVIYCISQDIYSYRLYYFSSECEVEFCGHGTIACIYELIKSSDELIELPTITITTNKGELTVYNELKSHDAVFITAPAPQYHTVLVNTNDITDNIGIHMNAIDMRYPIELIDTGLKTLIVPINNINEVLQIKPNECKLKDFCLSNDIDIILTFTTDTIDENNKARTRVFAPKFGYLEDPATGSGNSAFGYYMLSQKLWNGEAISIEQNGERNNYNIVKLKTIDKKVLFGGNAITKIEGHYLK